MKRRYDRAAIVIGVAWAVFWLIGMLDSSLYVDGIRVFLFGGRFEDATKEM